MREWRHGAAGENVSPCMLNPKERNNTTFPQRCFPDGNGCAIRGVMFSGDDNNLYLLAQLLMTGEDAAAMM